MYGMNFGALTCRLDGRSFASWVVYTVLHECDVSIQQANEIAEEASRYRIR